MKNLMKSFIQDFMGTYLYKNPIHPQSNKREYELMISISLLISEYERECEKSTERGGLIKNLEVLINDSVCKLRDTDVVKNDPELYAIIDRYFEPISCSRPKISNPPWDTVQKVHQMRSAISEQDKYVNEAYTLINEQYHMAIHNDRLYMHVPHPHGSYYSPISSGELAMRVKTFCDNKYGSTGLAEAIANAVTVLLINNAKHSYNSDKYVYTRDKRVSLSSLQSSAISSKMFHTSYVDVVFRNGDYNTPLFDKCLNILSLERNETKSRIMEIMGYCLSGDTTISKLFVIRETLNELDPITFLLCKMVKSSSNVNFINGFSYVQSVLNDVFNGKHTIVIPSGMISDSNISFLNKLILERVVDEHMELTLYGPKDENKPIRSVSNIICTIHKDKVPIVSEAPEFLKECIPVDINNTDSAMQLMKLALESSERSAIFNKLMLAYHSLRKNNYVFTEDGSEYCKENLFTIPRDM